MTNSTDTIRVIRCQFSGEQYALEMSTVPSVRQLSEVVPTASGEFPGQLGHLPVANAAPVPVFSLAERLGRPGSESRGRQHVVVAQTSRGPLGLVVDTVSHVLAIATSNLIGLPSLLNNPTKRVVKNVVDFAAIEETGAQSGSDMSLLLSPERLHPAAAPLTPDPRRKPAANEKAVTGTQSARRGGQMVLLAVTDEESASAPLVGLSVTQIAEILEPSAVVPVPFSPEDVPGFVVWRNQPVPVVEIGHRFGLPGKSADQRLVIARGRGDSELFAFMAQSRMRPLRLPVEHQAIEIPSDLDRTTVRAAFTIESGTVLVPDIQSIVCA